jgi:predicted aldo/keto reductase-like oxidoreductase
MIRYAIEHGVNYVDTAYPYHSGNSEVILGKILNDGYREKVKLATKSPVWLIKKPEDFDKYLEEQLKRLNTQYIDFYLFHGMNKQRWDDIVMKFNLIERAESALKDGKIKYLGFSFHDKFESFKEIIDSYKGWTFCQIQYNFLDTKNQAGTKGLKYAASKGLAVVIMEPLLGGKLANPPSTIRKIYEESGIERSPPEWAFQWLWNQQEISVVLSGMSAFNQVKSNIESAASSRIGSMKKQELLFINRLQKKYHDLIPIHCTKCGYCMPCPNGVNIPENFEIYNNGFIHDDMKHSRISYSRFLAEKERASACKQCKECEEKCPQKIKISELMLKLDATLGEKKS